MAFNIHYKTTTKVSTLPTGSNFIITDLEVPEWPEDVDAPVEIESGCLLPTDSGFPFKLEEPRPSFKVFRAMLNKGLSHTACSTLSKYRRSIVTPNNVWNGVKMFWGATAPRTDLAAYYRALDELHSQFGDAMFIPQTMDAAQKRLPQNTSPGLPYIQTHKGMKKGEVYDNFSRNINAYWERVGSALPVHPLPDCAAFARSNISTVDKNKVRPVWAYPMLAVCEEARFAVPIIDHFVSQKGGHNTAYGAEMMRGGMEWLNSQMIQAKQIDPECKFLMTDYSSFDANVPAWLIRDVFGIIADHIDFDHVTDGVNVHSADGEAQRRRFQKCVNYFINTPIRNCDGRRFLKDHGIPSGTMFTNILGTLCNMVISRCCLDLTFQGKVLFDVYFGDDSFICLSGDAPFDMDNYTAAAKDVVSAKVNTAKSGITRNPINAHFLGYYNNRGQPFKGTESLIAAMLFPQYLQDDWAYCLSRALGCVLASAGSDAEVFLAAQSVYDMAVRHEQKVMEAFSHLEDNPRAFRHLSQMGCGDLVVTDKFFRSMTQSVPRSNCTKLLKDIQLVKR